VASGCNRSLLLAGGVRERAERLVEWGLELPVCAVMEVSSGCLLYLPLLVVQRPIAPIATHRWAGVTNGLGDAGHSGTVLALVWGLEDLVGPGARLSMGPARWRGFSGAVVEPEVSRKGSESAGQEP